MYLKVETCIVWFLTSWTKKLTKYQIPLNINNATQIVIEILFQYVRLFREVFYKMHLSNNISYIKGRNYQNWFSSEIFLVNAILPTQLK